ncbi:MAG: hypothetical protein R3212_01805, partial [Xanthomonadales bacterium]|nr:hypothetical protein [Xanthomonadales bacterium]
AAMAIVNLVLAFERGGLVEKNRVNGELDRMFSRVADPYDYSDEEFAASIRALAQQLGAEPG